jgi:FixJ family two-component response regulator
LVKSNANIPIIFVTGHGYIEMSVKVMEAQRGGFFVSVRQTRLPDAIA